MHCIFFVYQKLPADEKTLIFSDRVVEKTIFQDSEKATNDKCKKNNQSNNILWSVLSI